MIEDIKLNPQISVVIPVKNEARYLANCLQGILQQTVPVLEIIVIDSGSDDGSQAIARSFEKVRVVEISPESFNHGETRNLGAKLAQGDYIMFTVGDAVPKENDLLAQLLSGFVSDYTVAVCGMQVVKRSHETNPLEWFNPQSTPKIKTYQFSREEDFVGVSSALKHKVCGWDNVCAMYRKDVINKIKFKSVVYGEDVCWIMDAINQGHEFSYQPAAQVYHFHNENYATVFKRTIAVSFLRYTSIGYIPINIKYVERLLRGWVRILFKVDLPWRSKLYWCVYNFQSLRAINKGIKYFNRALTDGSEGLMDLQLKYCGSPPIPLKDQ